MKAKKTKSGKYKVVVSAGKDASGKYRQKAFTAPTRKEAELLAAQYQMQRKEDRKSPTIDFAISSYISSRSAVCSPKTILEYERMQKNYFDCIREKQVCDLTNEDIQRFINDLAFHLAPKTVDNIISLLRSALKQNNPDRRYNYTLPADAAIERHIPDDEDLKKLMELSRPNKELHLAIILSAFGSLRRSEICGLSYEDIYRDFNAIYVHSAVVLDHNNNWIHKKYTKNRQSTRQVIYSKEVIDLIGQGTGRIFKCTPDYLTSSFCNLRDRLGLKCRFHDLRHYTISTMHAIGIPDQYIQQRSGHKTDKTMKEVYRNPLKSQSNVFVAKINNYFSENFKDELKPENENNILTKNENQIIS